MAASGAVPNDVLHFPAFFAIARESVNPRSEAVSPRSTRAIHRPSARCTMLPSSTHIGALCVFCLPPGSQEPAVRRVRPGWRDVTPSVLSNRLKRSAHASLLVGGDEHGGRPALVAFILDPNNVRACTHSGQLKRRFSDVLLIDKNGSAGRYRLDLQSSSELLNGVFRRSGVSRRLSRSWHRHHCDRPGRVVRGYREQRGA
jgi:hypothetical protein